MKEVRKGFNRVEDYARIVKRVHAHGIAVQAGIVFGFDNDTPAIFKDTLDFLEETGIQNATFNILTPYPGTPLFQRLDAQGRILTRDWRKYNGRTDVVFQPNQMSVDELLAGFRYANRRFYSLRQCGETAVAIARPDRVDSAVEPGVCGLMGARAMRASMSAAANQRISIRTQPRGGIRTGTSMR